MLMYTRTYTLTCESGVLVAGYEMDDDELNNCYSVGHYDLKTFIIVILILHGIILVAVVAFDVAEFVVRACLEGEGEE